MKRLLFLAYLFPPIANSGTQRSLKFAKYLSEYGWETTVLTASQFHGHAIDAGLLRDVPADVRVVRVPMLNERIGALLTLALGGGVIASRLGDAVRWRLQNRRRAPDFHAWWQPTAFRRAMRLHRESPFNAILATGYPWTALVAGCALSKATGVPLVADFRDLWAGERLFRDTRPPVAEELALEAEVLAGAAKVVTASATIARRLMAAHPDVDHERFVTIHNGFDPVDLDVPPHPPAPDRRFRIVFTGVWKDGYNPAELYDAVEWIRRAAPALLDHVEVITAGFPPGEAERRGLQNVITERGVVSHHDAVALMRSADVLYLSHVDRDRQWVVPGKLYEYLASGSPVLALTHPDCETAEIITRVGGGIVISPEDPGELYETLRHALEERRLAVPPRVATALGSFERRHLTAKLAHTLDDVMQGSDRYIARASRTGSDADETSSSYAGSTSAHPFTRVVS